MVTLQENNETGVEEHRTAEKENEEVHAAVSPQESFATDTPSRGSSGVLGTSFVLFTVKALRIYFFFF